MSLAAALDGSQLARTTAATRVLVVSAREELRWLVAGLVDAGLAGAILRRTSAPPEAEVRPDLIVVDDLPDDVIAAAWRRWLTGPGAGAPAVILGGAPIDADPATVVWAPVDAGPGRLAGALATAFERGRAHAAQTQLALRASRHERRLSAFLDHSPEAFGLLDRHGRFTFVPASAPTMHGHGAGELLGKELFGLLHPDDQAGARARFQALLAAPRATARFTVRRRLPRGHDQHLEVTATNLLAEPDVGAVVASFHNVDERERTILALRASEQRLHQLLRELPVVLWSQRADGDLDYLSPDAARLWGRDLDALRADGGAAWREAIHPDDRPGFDAAVAAGAPASLEVRIVRPDGGLGWLELALRPVRDAGGALTGVLGVAHDVGERRQRDAQLVAVRADAALGALASAVAHDVHNVTAALQLHCELLQHLPLPEAARDDVAVLAGLGARFTAITEPLCGYVRRTRAPALVPVDLTALVQALAPALAHALGPGRTLALALEPDLPAVPADPLALERALLALALNAREATPGAGQVTIGVRASEAQVVLTVRDDGAGMDADTCRQALAPCFTTRGAGRAGLGLTVVAQTVRRHDGTLQLDSAPGRGTTVTIGLPR